MKKILILPFLIWQLALFAQNEVWQQIIEDKVPKKYNMSAALYQLGKYALHDEELAWEKALLQNLVLNKNEKLINIEILDLTEKDIDTIYIKNLEEIYSFDISYKNRSSIFIKLKDLIPLAVSIKDNYFLSVARYPDTNNEGPGLMNTVPYINNNKIGNGIRIGVIDLDFDGLTEANNQSVIPGFYIAQNYTSDPLEDTVDVHGTACLEILYDHAPGALYFVYKIANLTHLGNVVNNAKSNNLDILSHSLAWFNTGWHDNSGNACLAANDAADNGVLFFTAAGNYANQNWSGNFIDADNDNLHEWTGNDEINNLTLAPGITLNAYLNWNNDLPADYDLWIVNQAGNILASSTSSSGFESASFTNTGTSNINVGVVVNYISGAKPVFQLLTPRRNLETSVASNSLISPANSINPRVISVGAVHMNIYDTLPGSNVIVNYSSQGPTNDGNMGIDIVAPTSTTTVSYNGGFSGTSCATPNAAGMTAAFWSAHPYLSSSGVIMIIERKAELYKDWGASGVDPIYGKGGVYLYDYYPLTRYLLRSGGNILNFSGLPFYNAANAQAGTPANGRVVVLGQLYPEPLLLDKKLLWISIMEDAGLGY